MSQVKKKKRKIDRQMTETALLLHTQMIADASTYVYNTYDVLWEGTYYIPTYVILVKVIWPMTR